MATRVCYDALAGISLCDDSAKARATVRESSFSRVCGISTSVTFVLIIFLVPFNAAWPLASYLESSRRSLVANSSSSSYADCMCETVLVNASDGVSGAYTQVPGVTHLDRPVFQRGENLLFYSKRTAASWVGATLADFPDSSMAFVESSSNNASCPTDSLLTWRFWDGSAWIAMSPVVASCPPPLPPLPLPSPPLPAACVCDKARVGAPGVFWSGVFTRQPNLLYLGRPVYRNGDSYLYYSSHFLGWKVDNHFEDDGRAFMATSRTNAQCPTDTSLAWFIWVDDRWESMDPAVADCESPPSMPPINQPPARPVPPRPPPLPPVIPAADSPPLTVKHPLTECGCSNISISFSTTRLAFLSGKYEASTDIVGGRHVYTRNNYYLFFSEGLTDWFLSNSIKSSGGWLKSDNDASYCPASVRSWFIPVDGDWTLDPEVDVSCFSPDFEPSCGCESLTVFGLPPQVHWMSGVYEVTDRKSIDDRQIYERAGILLYFWPLTQRWQLGEYYGVNPSVRTWSITSSSCPREQFDRYQVYNEESNKYELHSSISISCGTAEVQDNCLCTDIRVVTGYDDSLSAIYYMFSSAEDGRFVYASYSSNLFLSFDVRNGSWGIGHTMTSPYMAISTGNIFSMCPQFATGWLVRRNFEWSTAKEMRIECYEADWTVVIILGTFAAVCCLGRLVAPILRHLIFCRFTLYTPLRPRKNAVRPLVPVDAADVRRSTGAAGSTPTRLIRSQQTVRDLFNRGQPSEANVPLNESVQIMLLLQRVLLERKQGRMTIQGKSAADILCSWPRKASSSEETDHRASGFGSSQKRGSRGMQCALFALLWLPLSTWYMLCEARVSTCLCLLTTLNVPALMEYKTLKCNMQLADVDASFGLSSERKVHEAQQIASSTLPQLATLGHMYRLSNSSFMWQALGLLLWLFCYAEFYLDRSGEPRTLEPGASSAPGDVLIFSWLGAIVCTVFTTLARNQMLPGDVAECARSLSWFYVVVGDGTRLLKEVIVEREHEKKADLSRAQIETQVSIKLLNDEIWRHPESFKDAEQSQLDVIDLFLSEELEQLRQKKADLEETLQQLGTLKKYTSGLLSTGEASEAVLGIHSLLRIDEKQLWRGMFQGIAHMEAEVAQNGEDEDRECFDYVLRGRCGENQRLWEHSGGKLMDAFYTVAADGRAGQTLNYFHQHKSSRDAHLLLEHVVALRLYTTAAYRTINSNLRKRNKPHPFPVTVAFLTEGIKRLRAVGAIKNAGTDTESLLPQTSEQGQDENTKEEVAAVWEGPLWRGLSDVSVDKHKFREEGGTEYAPFSTSSDYTIALHYSSGSNAEKRLLFQVSTSSFIDRGASLQFLSAFPDEAEFLYPPLTYLKPTGKQEVMQVGNIEYTVIEVIPHISM